jgi:hypothetical protein
MKIAPILLLSCLFGCTALETRPVKVTQTFPPGSINPDSPIAMTRTGATAARENLVAAAETVSAPKLASGQQWTYRRIDLWRNEETERFRQELIFEEAGHWMTRWTILNSDDPVRRGSVTGELLDPISHAYADKKVSGRYEPLRFPLATGKTWSFKYEINGNLRKTTVQQQAKVIRWETVTVPAGKYRALRIEHQGTYAALEGGFSWSGTMRETYWYAPAVSRVVMREYRDTKGDGGVWDQWRDELVDYSATNHQVLPIREPSVARM